MSRFSLCRMPLRTFSPRPCPAHSTPCLVQTRAALRVLEMANHRPSTNQQRRRMPKARTHCAAVKAANATSSPSDDALPCPVRVRAALRDLETANRSQWMVRAHPQTSAHCAAAKAADATQQFRYLRLLVTIPRGSCDNGERLQV